MNENIKSMEPKIISYGERKLIGKRMKMSFADNRTYELWRSFMPVRKEIRNAVSAELFSVQLYGKDFDFSSFNPSDVFDKWAAMEVSDFDFIPDGMEALVIPAGLYAIFIHRGPSSEGQATFGYIFEKWLPSSAFTTDYRPHFEILGEKYRNDSYDSEEEVWIPVRLRVKL